MESQNNAKLNAEIESYKSIISQKQEQNSAGKISYNWQEAEEAIIKQLQRAYPQPTQALEVIKNINILQQLCIDKLIPPFYSYHTIASIVILKDSVLNSLQEQANKISKGQSSYQQIAIQLTLQESLLNSLVQKQRAKENCSEEIQQLRRMHSVTIYKINEWERKVSLIMGYPVFFIWAGKHYLVALSQSKSQQDSHSSFKSHLQIHQLFTNTNAELSDLQKECSRILKNQKGRQLELILNLPFFAVVKKEKKNENINNLTEKSRVTFKVSKSVGRLRKTELTKKGAGLEILGNEELQVIKRFRSYKKIGIKPKDPQKNALEAAKAVDLKLRDRITSLKQRVRQKQIANHTRQISQEKIKPLQKTIRVLYEKEVEINDNSPLRSYAIIQALMTKTKTDQLSPKQNESRVKSDFGSKLLKLQNEMSKVASLNSKKKEQIQLKSQNLSALKLQLMQKVKQSHQSEKRLSYSKLSSRSELQKKIKFEPVSEQKGIFIAQEALKEKEHKQKQKNELIKIKGQTKNLVIKAEQQLSQYAQEREKTNQMLKEKIFSVNRLKEKLESVSNYQQSARDTLAEQVNHIKLQKQVEFEQQKQKINEISQSLEERVKEEEAKHNQLLKKQQERERLLKQKLEREVELVRKMMEQEEARIKRQILEEETKRKQYQQKMARQKEENQKMLQEIQEWSLKENQLLLMLQQEQRKRQQRQIEQRLRRQALIDAQIKQLEDQQMEIVRQYKSTNNNLMLMLEGLKQKNYQLERKISPKN